jgi:YD repeat-containing protein
MVAIFTGAGAGFERGSGSVLGSPGLLGSAAMGRGNEQVFVNAATGNLMISHLDEFVTGLGLRASSPRTYNSLGDLSDDNTDDWRFGAEGKVFALSGTANTAGSTVHRMSSDGSDITYTYQAVNSVSAYWATDGAGAYDKLTLSNNVWTWTDGDTQFTETYSAFGTNNWVLSSQTDNDGHTVTFDHVNGTSHINRIATADGSYIQYDWSGNNVTDIVTGYTDLATNTAKTLTRARYLYDASNRLQTVTVDLSPEDNSTADAKIFTTTYSYYGTTKLVSSIVQSDGSRIDVTYDQTSNPATSKVANIAETVSSGVTRSTALSYGAGFTTVTDALGQQVRLDYDASGNLKTITMPSATTNVAHQITQFAYDNLGNLTSVTDALGNRTTYKDTFGPELVTSGDGTSTSGWSATHSSLSLSNGALVVTSDNTGNQDYAFQQITGLVVGRTYSFSCDFGANNGLGNPFFYLGTSPNLGNIASITDFPNSGTHTFTFTATSTSLYVTLRSSSAGNGWSCTFDNVSLKQAAPGLPTTITDPFGNVTTRSYNARNQLISETRIGSDENSPSAAHTVNYVYDGTNDGDPFDDTHLRFRVSAEGDVVEYRYNALGLVTATLEYPGTNYVGAFDETSLNAWVSALKPTAQVKATETAYDARGNVLSTTTYADLYQNRLYNPEFSSTSGWLIGYNPNNIVVAGSPYVGSLSGTTFIKEDLNATAANQVASIATDTNYLANVYPGENLFVQAGIGTSGSVGTAQLVVQFWDANGTYLGVVSVGSVSGTLAYNTKIWGNVSVPATAVTARLEVYAYSSAAGAGSVTLTQPVLESSASFLDFGDNLVQGSRFEEGATGWGMWQQQPGMLQGNMTVGRDTGTGKRFLQQSFTSSASSNLVSFYSGGFMPVDDGARLAVRAGVGGTSGINHMQINVQFFDENGNWLVGVPSELGVGEVNSAPAFGTQISGFINAPAGAKYMRLVCYASASSLNTTQTIYLSEPSITTVTAAQAAVAAFAPSVPSLSSPLGNNRSANFSRTDYAYDQSGRLLSSQAFGRNAQHLVYDGMGRLTSAVDVNGGTTTYAFNDANTTTTVSFASGLVQTSVYSKTGELVSFTEAAAPTSPPAIVGARQYAYDQIGQLRWMVDATGDRFYYIYDHVGRKVADVSATGEMVEYRYDPDNRIVQATTYTTRLTSAQITGLGTASTAADINALRPARDDQHDLWTWTIYDKDGRVLQTIDGAGDTSVNTYDGEGRLIQKTGYFNPIDATSLNNFRAASPTIVTLPAASANDQVTRNLYDKDGLLVGTLDSNNFLTKITYDAAGQKVQQTAYASPVTVTDPNYTLATAPINKLVVSANAGTDRTTHFAYDGEGQLRFIIDASGNVIENDYDGAGQVTCVTRYATPIAQTGDYSCANVRSLLIASGAASNALNRQSWNVYNFAGHLAYAIDAEGGVTAFDYNASGEVAKQIEFAAARPTTSPPDEPTMYIWRSSRIADSGNRVTRYYYDGAGVLRYTADGEGYVSFRTEDAEGRLTSVTRYDRQLSLGDGDNLGTVTTALSGSAGVTTNNHYDYMGRLDIVTDGEGNQTVYDRIGNGKVLQVKVAANSSTDQSVTAYAYDGAGRVINEFHATGTPDQALTRYTYDGLGNVLTTTDPDNHVTTFAYDKVGNLASKTDALNGVTHYYYDAFGNVILEVDPLGHSTYNYYDALNRLIRTRDGEDFITETAYNVFGDVTSATRRFNKTGSPASVGAWPTVTPDSRDATTSFAYDRAGRLKSTTDAAGATESYLLNAFGDRVSVTNKLGGVTANSYDRRGLLVSEVLPMLSIRGDGSVEATSVTNSFGYDARGNRTSMVEAAGLTEQRTTLYTYDKNDRLKTKVSNVVSVVSSSDFWTTNSVNPTETYQYDHRGNQILLADANGAKTYSYYDALNRKVGEVNALGTLSRCTYDAAGNKTSETVYGNAVALPASAGGTAPDPVDPNNGHTTTYIYDGLNRLWKTDVANVLVGTWSSVNNGVSTAAVTAESVLAYDAHGNVASSTDANGNISYNWYDRLNRKTDQIDAAGYLTHWTYDDEGNVVSESRYASKFSGTPNPSGPAPTVAADPTNDRTTTFTYDRTGHRLSETRANVAIATVGTSNSVTPSTVNSTVTYSYNALGQVTSKTEATADQTFYSYDLTGRLIEEIGTSFRDYAGAGVQRQVIYSYDGLNSLTRTEQGGNTYVASMIGTDWSVAGHGDFNGDGRQDILWRGTDGAMTDWLGQTNGSFAGNDANAWNVVSLDWKIAGTGDFNGDGKSDILWRNDDGRVTDWLGTASGGFADNASNALQGVGTDWKVAGTGDFNGDGKADILWRNDNGNVVDWLGTATGGFAGNGANSTNGVGLDWHIAGTGDFNGDGRADILWRNDNGTVTNWLGQLNGGFVGNGANFSTGVPLGWKIVGTGDVNGDGRSDILWLNDSGDFTDWLGQTNGGMVSNDTNAYNRLPVNWKVGTLGDFNGDGRADIFWRDTSGLDRLWQAVASGGFATGNMAVSRATTYAYGPGGRLGSITDPAGQIHSYGYDAAGNLLRDSYTRAKSDGSTVNEAILYTRDLLGRVTSQAIATNNGTQWIRGDSQNTQYDAFGQVAQRGVNGLWQESFTYNKRGLVEKTNSGDGVWRFFVYDRNGNQVLAIESEGSDYSSTSLGDTVTTGTLLNSLGTYAGATFIDGVDTTVSVYDNRNQLTQTVQLQRELTSVGSGNRLTSSQSYNGFGEVATQTDALSNTTIHSYNTMGRLTQKVMPQVSVTSAAGVVSSVSPTENYYYDASGRQVATRDANGNVVSRTLLTGTGYGGTDAQVTAEYRADGGTGTAYDVFGDARTVTDELNRNETRTYDGMGRLATTVRRTGLQEAFTYDLLGQQVKHVLKNTAGTVLATDTTDYDLQGRVVTTVDQGGDKTNVAYAWNGGLTNPGMSGATAIGGWIKTVTMFAQLSSTLWKTRSETTDVHGLTTTESDLGGNVTNYTYDRAGRLTQKQGTAGAITSTLAYTYFNTGMTATVVDTGGSNYNSITSTFGYDADGHRTKEKYSGTVYRSASDTGFNTFTSSAQTLQDATMTYDGLGRLATFSSTGTTGTTSVNQYYDAAGNIRHTQTTYPNLVSGGVTSTDKWFTYDSLNRMVVADGSLSGGAISGGTSFTYNAAGNRKTALKGAITETYNYDADNQLTTVLRNGATEASTTRDIRGRVTEYIEYLAGSPTGVSSHRFNIVYNTRGQISSESDYQWVNGGTDVNATSTNAYDSYGNITSNHTVNSGSKDTGQTWNYAWKDVAVVADTHFDSDYNSSTNNIWDTLQYYDGLGRMQRAVIDDGRNRAVDFALDGDGKVLSRVQNDGTSNDPAEYHLYVGGVQIANYTNDSNEDTQNYDYQSLITTKTVPTASGSGRFYRGSSFGTAGAETGTSGYDPINAITAGTSQSSRARYTVQAGDTLQGIAQNLWGDSSLWYLIADANGISADTPLAAGQNLAIPLKGPSNFNNANMFRPYDAASAVGDLSPTSAKPPKKGKCGAFGQILLVAIQVAVTVALSFTPVGPIGGAVIGDIVKQGVGMATGIQPGGFSFKEVGITALTAVLTPPGTGDILADAANAAITNAEVQGIAVATGLQKKFDWLGVAAAGISAGVMTGVSNALVGPVDPQTGARLGRDGRALTAAQMKQTATIWNSASGVGNIAARSAAGAIANAATRTLISGGDFGDNLLAGLPDLIAQTLGGMLENRLKGLDALEGQVPQTAANAAQVGTGDGVKDQPTTSGSGATFTTRADLPADPWGILAQADQTVTEFTDDMGRLNVDLESAWATHGAAEEVLGFEAAESDGLVYLAGSLGLAAINGAVPASDLLAAAVAAPAAKPKLTKAQIEAQRRAKLLAQDEGDAQDPDVKAFLKTVSWAEGTEKYGYNTMYGIDKSTTDLSHFPGSRANGSSASGRYQIVKEQYEKIGQGELGLTDFSPRSQDLIAVQQMREIGVIDAVKRGDVVNAISDASRLWASIPKGPGAQDVSRYTMLRKTKAGGYVRVRQPNKPYAQVIAKFYEFRKQQ